MTTPTAPAAGVHLPWARVPEAVQAWAARLGGGTPPRTVRDLSGGFSPGATSILAWPGTALFVKAVGASLNPESPDMHRREGIVSAALPAAGPFPRLRDLYDDGDWVALAFDVVEGRPPRHPWVDDELDAVVRALRAMHGELTPSPAAGLTTLAERAAGLFTGWEDLAALPTPPTALDPWAADNLGRLAELAARWPAASAGATLLHGDVRSDNVLLDGERVVFVDWPHAAIGNPAFDLVAWAPSVVLEGGPRPEELLASYERPARMDPDAVTVLLCAVTGFFVAHSLRPAPPGLPTLRPFQAAQGTAALGWLRQRLGW